MTPAEFSRWLSDMIASGKARNKSDCARALGYRPADLHRIETRGGDQRLALACAALLAGVAPYADH